MLMQQVVDWGGSSILHVMLIPYCLTETDPAIFSWTLLSYEYSNLVRGYTIFVALAGFLFGQLFFGDF